MKIFFDDKIVINKNIEDIFNIIYNNNKNFINEDQNISVICKEVHEWKLKNKIIQRNEYITVCFKNLPDVFSKKLDNDNKHIRIKMITKILFKDPENYKVQTKYKLDNLSPLISSIVNKMKLIKSKCIITMKQNSDGTSELILHNKTSIAIAIPQKFEDFITNISKSLFENMKEEIYKTI